MTDVAALEIRGLSVGYMQRQGGTNTVVWNVDLTLERGKILGLAGESGCGKSTTALAAIGYRAGAMKILEGQSVLGDTDLLGLHLKDLRGVWGSRVVYVPQASSNALTPALTIGTQLAEPMRMHLGLKGHELRRRQIELLDEVGVPNPGRALERYPHQFSGGQQQRICLAIALSCNPDVLILDEPTTGLDVTTQARIVKLLNRVVAEHDTAALFVSHDLPLLGKVADRIAIMYGGQVIEQGPVAELMAMPGHPYTKALLAAVPDPQGRRALVGIPGSPPTSVEKEACPFAARCPFAVDACTSTNPDLITVASDHSVRCIRVGDLGLARAAARPLALPVVDEQQTLLHVDDVWCAYRSHGQATPVVKGISFDVARGETLAIVGESGSGKSTLLRSIAGLHPRSAGAVFFDDQELAPNASRRSRAVRRDVQIVFQNPDMSLNPRHDVMSLIARPLQLFQSEMSRSDREARVRQLLDDVNLPQSLLHRFPGELSGGQKQRIAIARAFASNPRLVLADEITSALDVSVQAAILDLLSQLSAEHGTSVVFVSHDLAVVRAVAHRALVMQHGVAQEIGTVTQIFSAPRHEYTRELLSAIPAYEQPA